jgi:hypothetical protein
MYKIYLDDVRVPKDSEWILVKNYDEFVNKIKELGLENISTISLDHDLGESAMREYFNNVAPNYELNYDNITEKTGLDCAKWLIDHYLENQNEEFNFPHVYTHSANPIGSANIMGLVNNFLKNMRKPQTCVRVRIDHTINQ